MYYNTSSKPEILVKKFLSLIDTRQYRAPLRKLTNKLTITEIK